MNRPVVIETRDLVHVYKGSTVKALDGVSMQIHENDFVSIIGQNGSGKTTVVRHFNGLLQPTSGEVLVDGEVTTGKSVAELSRKVGYVFQNPNHQLFSKTVREELEVGPNNFQLPAEEKKRNIDCAVELLGLQSILEVNPLLLDYTTKKIVSIASILTFDPKVLIMDEPTGGLDEPGREMLMRVVNLTKEAGHTILLISHDMDFVAEHSERIIVMADAKVVCNADARQVFANPELLRTAKIEPPQVTQLDIALGKNPQDLTLSVPSFVKKYS